MSKKLMLHLSKLALPNDNFLNLGKKQIDSKIEEYRAKLEQIADKIIEELINEDLVVADVINILEIVNKKFVAEYHRTKVGDLIDKGREGESKIEK